MLGQGLTQQGQGLQFPWQQALSNVRQGKMGNSGGMNLSSLLGLLAPMMMGGQGGGMTGLGQAQKMGQNALGMGNQSLLSLFNPNYGGQRPWR